MTLRPHLATRERALAAVSPSRCSSTVMEELSLSPTGRPIHRIRSVVWRCDPFVLTLTVDFLVLTLTIDFCVSEGSFRSVEHDIHALESDDRK